MGKCEKCLYYKSKTKCGECGRLSNAMDNNPMFTPNTNYDRIKSMSVEEMAAFIVKTKKIFVEDAYKGITEFLNKQKKFKGYSIEIDNSKIADWEKEEFETYKQWLLQEVSENE